MSTAAEHVTSSATLIAAADLVPVRADGGRDLALYDVVSSLGALRSRRLSELVEVGYETPTKTTPGWAEGVSMQDRQIALLRLALSLGRWPAWFKWQCGACGENVDLRVSSDEFVIHEATSPCPKTVDVQGPDGKIVPFRIPTGEEERRIEADPSLGLTRACAALPLDAEELPAWEAAFDAQLQDLLPRFEPELSFTCPECGAPASWWFDPMEWIARHAGKCLADVDIIAKAYGWSEKDILALPEPRRRKYVAMIEARQ